MRAPRVGLVALGAVLLLVGCGGPRRYAPAFAPLAGTPDRAAAGWRALLDGDRPAATQALDGVRSPEGLAGQALLAAAAGRDPAAGEAWLSIVEHDPDHPLATVAAIQLHGLAQRWDGLDGSLRERLPSLLDRAPGPEPVARERLRQALILALRRAGEIAAADHQVRALGLLDQWSVAGPFGRFAPLEDPAGFWPSREGRAPEPAPSEEGSDAAPPWQEVLGTGRPGDPFEDSTRRFRAASTVAGRVRLHAEPTRGGVYYARSRVANKRATTARLVLRTTASAVVWVDGEEVLRRDRFDAFGPVTSPVTLRLGGGPHEILVALATESSRPGFSLALTDADGRPLDGLAQLPGEAPGATLAGASLTTPRPGAHEHYTAESAEAPDNPLPHLWLALLARAAGDPVAAEAHVHRVGELAPAAAALGVVVAAVLLEDPALPRKERRDRARAALELALERDPETVVALYWLARLEQQEGRESRARELLRQAVELRPESYRWWIRLYKIHVEAGWIREAEAALERAAALAPGAPSVLESQLRWARRRRDLGRVAELTRQSAARNPDSQILARRQARAGQLATAAAELERLSRRRPQDGRLRRLRATLQASLGAWDEASALLAEGPGSARELKQQASYQLLAGQSERAAELLERVRELDPDNTRLPLAAALLADRIPLDEFAIDPQDEIAALSDGQGQEQEDAARPDLAGAAAELVLDQYLLDLTAPGSPLERVHTLARVRTKEGVREWGEARVPADAIVLSLKVIKADGRFLEPEAVANKETISMPGLEVGDFVDLEYVMVSPLSAVFPGGYLGSPFFFRVHAMPVRHSQVAVLAPADAPPVLELTAGAPEPQVAERDGRLVFLWDRWDLPPVQAEPQSVPAREYLPGLRVGYRVQRADHAPALASLIPERLRADRALAARAEEVAGGLSAPRDRVRALYAAVLADVPATEGSRGIQESATHVLARRRGSRTILLAALLRAAGIDADVVAVQPFGQPEVARELPDLGEFPYFVVRARPDSRRPIWLDASFRFGQFDYLGPVFQDRPALVLDGEPRDDEDLRTPTFPLRRERKDIALELQLDADGTLHGRGVEQVRGWMAINLREALIHMQPFQRRQMFELALARYFPGLSVEASAIEAIEQADEPLRLEYRFTVPSFARRVGGRLLVERSLYPLRLGASFLRLAERRLPLLIDARNFARIQVRLTLPPGARIEVAPEATEVDGEFGRYELRREDLAHGLVLTKVLNLPPRRIAPEEYAEFAEFCHTVDRAEDAETVILLEPEAAAE